METTKEFLKQHVEKSRRQLRSKDFIQLSKNSLSLTGKSLPSFLSSLAGRGKKVFELVVPDEGKTGKRLCGDMVTAADVFRTSENIVWDGADIRFLTKDGIAVSGYQYDYIAQNGLEENQIFAKSNRPETDVPTVWKNIVRRADDARKDKIKEILYITVGSIEWTTKEGKKAISPLFACSVREEKNNGERLRFRVTGDCFRINGIAGRAIKEQTGIDVFEGVSPEVGFGALLEESEKIKAKASRIANIRFRDDDINVCILDSANETVCQAVEKMADELAASEMVRVLSGERPNPFYDDTGIEGIYPLLADDSQRDVIRKAIAGCSVNVNAPAGTGKSQTMVNIAANMAVMGKSACVMSEKAAANEVFLKYAASIGLDTYCLSIENTMTVSDIVSQIIRIVNAPRYYVNATAARETLADKLDVDRELDEFGNGVYREVPELGCSVYDLIGEAIAFPPPENLDSIRASGENYSLVKSKIRNFRDGVMRYTPEKDFFRYVKDGTSGQEEVDEMLRQAVEELLGIGVDPIAFARDNKIEDRICERLSAAVAFSLASVYMKNRKLNRYGNILLCSLYSRLVSVYDRMTALYRAFMLQEISARVAHSVRGNPFVALLDKLKTNQHIRPIDLFEQYGKEILRLCPIIVSTPGIAVNYILNSMNTFDVLMIDEASQVPVTGVLPFLAGKKQLITFGDAMQLGVSDYFAQSDTDGRDEEGTFDIDKTDKSILHVVSGKLSTCNLLFHFRSKCYSLLVVSNETCYDGILNLIPDVYTDKDNLPDYLGYELCVSDDDSATNNAGINHVEAEAIAKRVCKIKDETPEKTIGIIAFNEKQQNHILDLLETRHTEGLLCCDLNRDDEIWIRSIETAQGKEADVVLISIGHTARRADGKIRQAISDIHKPGGVNKLNVLFTRAREKNIVFLSFDYKDLRFSDNQGLARLYRYLNYADTGETDERSEKKKRTDDKLNENWEKILESSEVYTPKAKVGNNVLLVDMALVDKDKTDKYCLGMLFAPEKLTPNTLYTKITVLERAGWKLVPVSPVQFIGERKEIIRNAEQYVLRETLPFCGQDEKETYLVETCPTSPILPAEVMCEKSILCEEEQLPEKKAFGYEDVLSIDFERAYRKVIPDSILLADDSVLMNYVKNNNPEATLVFLTRRLPKLLCDDFYPQIVQRVTGLYRQGLKAAGYLLAQLLRVREDDNGNADVIEKLLNEAAETGVGETEGKND